MNTIGENYSRQSDSRKELPPAGRNSLAFQCAFFAGLLLAVCSLGWVAYLDARDAFRADVSRRFTRTLMEADVDVGQRLGKLMELAQGVAAVPSVVSALGAENAPSKWAVADADLRDMFQRARITLSQVGNVLVFNKQGDAIIDIEGQRIRTAPWGEADPASLPPFGSNLRQPDGKPVIYACAPIIIKGKAVGTAVVTVNMENLRDDLRRRFVGTSKVGVVLLNDSGVVLLSTSSRHFAGDIFGADPQHRAVTEAHGVLNDLQNGARLGMSWRVTLHPLSVVLSDDVESLLEQADALWAHMTVYASVLLLFGGIGVYMYSRWLLRRARTVEYRFTEIVDLAGLPTWEWNADDNLQRLNSHFCMLLGRGTEPANVPRDALMEGVHPEDRDMMRRETLALRPVEKERFSWEIRLRHADGHWHWVDVTGVVAAWDRTGNPARAIGVALDIHEKKIRDVFAREYRSRLEADVAQRTHTLRVSEAELRRERGILQAVINTIPDIVYYRNTNKELIGANCAFYSFFGITPTEAAGRTTLDAVFSRGFDPETLTKLAAQDEHVLATGNTLHLDEELPLAEGEVMYFETTKSLMVDEDGVSIGTLGVSRDITPRKVAEKALEAAREDAVAASRAKSDFLANLSHEIRTPLNGIMGLTHLVLQQDPPEGVRKHLERLETSAQNLMTTVNDILDFSKIESGHIQLDYEPFSLEDAVNSAVGLLRGQAQKGGITLNVSLTPTVPRGIFGDSLRFEQALINLLSNAVKFTPRGGRVDLSLWTGPAKTSAQTPAQMPGDAASNAASERVRLFVCVEDTGIGITSEQLEKLFMPFSQAASPTGRKFDGTGLGLVITKALVECMGGCLNVESEPQKGSRFTFEMDITATESVLHLAEFSTTSKGAMPFKGSRILLVEDNEINQVVGTEMLRNLGCSVDVANDGREAVVMTERVCYDVVLMDIQMPNMDGYTATRIMRERKIASTIIAMTANAMPEDRKKTIDAGMQAHMIKPIDPVRLREELSRWIH